MWPVEEVMLVLGSLPVIELGRVFHVGRIGDPIRGRGVSYEGLGLSVSLCPEVWREIARLGNAPTVGLKRVDGRPGRFLDVLALSEAQQQELDAAGVSAGLLEPANVWAVEWADEEEGGTRRMLVPSLEEAVGEALLYSEGSEVAVVAGEFLAGERAGLSPEVLSALGVSEVPTVGATGVLERLWREQYPRDVPTGMAREAGWAVVLEERGELDGFWWEERLDVLALSAPRGSIFQARLTGWRQVPA